MPRRKKEDELPLDQRGPPRGAANLRERTRMRILSKAFGKNFKDTPSKNLRVFFAVILMVQPALIMFLVICAITAQLQLQR